MEKESRNIVAFNQNTTYRKSNFLISSKYKSTLLENKLLALCLMRIRKVDNELKSELTAAEIKRTLNKSNGSFYEQLRDTADLMTGRKICIEDRENNRFRIDNIIQSATYENGVFSVTYNNQMEKYLIGLQQNYTNLNVTALVGFCSVYSFRLYEMLRSKAYSPKREKNENNTYQINYTLSELKLEIGAVNTNLDRVQRVLNSPNPDFDKAVAVAEEKTFDRWGDFRSKVLEVAIKEINNPERNTGMQVEYTTVRKGRGGAVHDVYFFVTLLNIQNDETSSEKKNILSDDEKDDFLDYMYEMGIKLRIADRRSIAEAAGYDIEKIKNANNIYMQTNSEINNVTGWFIAAVKNEFSEPVKKESTTTNKFNNFTERKYNYEELEKLIVN